jgi:hypothetical protein
MLPTIIKVTTIIWDLPFSPPVDSTRNFALRIAPRRQNTMQLILRQMEAHQKSVTSSTHTFSTRILQATLKDNTAQCKFELWLRPMIALTQSHSYTEVWDQSYATNNGQYRGSDHYYVAYSFTYAISPNSAPAPKVGDKNGAIYQAIEDINYATLQPFCSSILGYSALLATATVTSTSTPFVTGTLTATVTVPAASAAAKRDVSTPNVLTKYPATVVSSACSMIVTQASSTSTVSTFTTVAIGAAATTFVTTTTTVAAAPTGCGQYLGSFAIQASDNSQYLVGGQGESSTAQFITSSLSAAQYFYLDENCILVESTGTYALFQAEQDTGAYQGGEPVYFASTTRIGDYSFIPIKCFIDLSYNLACTVQGNSINAVDEGEYGSDTWFLFDSVSDVQSSGLTQISVKAVPAPER